MLNFLKIIVFLVLTTKLWASTEATWYTLDNQNKAKINVTLFLSSTCTHCQKTNDFFKNIEKTNPWLNVSYHFINQDKLSLELFSQYLSAQNSYDFSVPAIFFCDSYWVGFDAAETTGNDLLKGLNYCKQQIDKERVLSPKTVSVLKRWGGANLFSTGIAEQPSIGFFVLITATLDALNPCSLFMWAGFLGILFIQNNKKSCLYSCLFIIFLLGLTHCFQQQNPNLFFWLLPWLRIPALLTGLWGGYIVYQFYQQRKLPSTFYWFLSLFVPILTLYQQTCLKVWPYVYTQWISHQQITALQGILVTIIYQFIYCLPLLLAGLIYSFKMRSSARLINIGLLFIAVIAMSLIIYPSLLSFGTTSLFILTLLVVAGYCGDRYSSRISRH